MNKIIGLIAVGVAGILFLALNPIVFIGTGQRGIKIRFGQVIGESMSEGMYFKTPMMDKILTFNVRTKKVSETTNTYTKDVQKVTVGYIANYNLDPGRVGEVFRKTGVDWENILLFPIIRTSVKEVIGKWDAVDLVSNRDKAASEIVEKIKQDASKVGVELSSLQINSIAFDPDFEKAVEAKVTAVQNAEQSKNVTVRIQEEAKQKVITAKAEAEAMKIKTEALAASPKLIDYEAVQVQRAAVGKWNGALPTTMPPNATLPFLNLGGRP